MVRLHTRKHLYDFVTVWVGQWRNSFAGLLEFSSLLLLEYKLNIIQRWSIPKQLLQRDGKRT